MFIIISTFVSTERAAIWKKRRFLIFIRIMQEANSKDTEPV